MRHFFRAYFNFNRRERRGVIVLLSIIAVLILVLNYLKHFSPPIPTDFSAFEREMEFFTEMQHQKKGPDSVLHRAPAEPNGPVPVLPVLHPFNPNGLPEAEWKQLGLTEKQIRTIRNFEARGGRFYKKEDLKKIYGLPAELYHILEPYIDIPVLHTKQRTVRPDSLPELNTCDSAALVELKGIGPVFAKRIIGFRKRLGGFCTKQQLLEVYGIDSVLYRIIHPQLTLDPGRIKTLNINTATAGDLTNHPYIPYRIALVLVSYREKHGPFKTVEAIKQIDLVNEDLYRKIAPYLSAD